MVEPKPLRTAAYLRVSTEEQSQAGTIETQRQKIYEWCRLHDVELTGLYYDDGVSGTIPLGSRSAGALLLRESAIRSFDRVVVYRLDRLGRSLKVLIEAHDFLQRDGVAIASCTEPIDTSTPTGRFIFSTLGSIGELERETIMERTQGGRDRVAQTGRWMGGPLPFGYTVDEGGQLLPDKAPISEYIASREDLVVDLFHRMAEGSTTVAQATRLQALGVPTSRRYSSGNLTTSDTPWTASSIRGIIRNPIYKGTYTYRLASGEEVSLPAPALVDVDLWARANAQVTRNRRKPKHGVMRDYLLSGMIRCLDCGALYAGITREGVSYYRCNRQLSSYYRAQRDKKCGAKMLPAKWLDAQVWEKALQALESPSNFLQDAQQQLEEAIVVGVGSQALLARVRASLSEKAKERVRQMALFRSGRATEEETYTILDDLTHEVAVLETEAQRLEARVHQEMYEEEDLDQALDNLLMWGRLHQVAKAGDLAFRRDLLRALDTRLTVATFGEARRKHATIGIELDLMATPVDHRRLEQALAGPEAAPGATSRAIAWRCTARYSSYPAY